MTEPISPYLPKSALTTCGLLHNKSSRFIAEPHIWYLKGEIAAVLRGPVVR